MPAARLARACVFFIRRRRGFAVCGAGTNDSSWRAPSQRPASTQLTGTCSAERAATSADASNVRFCCAPSTSSPSYSRTWMSSGLWTTRSFTLAPPGSSLTASALLDGLREGDVAHRRRAVGDQREHGERPDDASARLR